MKFLPQKARTKNNNADLISDLSEDEFSESIYSTSLTDVHNTGAVRRSYTNNTSSGSIKGSTRNSQLNNNSTPSKEVPSHTSNNPNIETQSTGGSSVSSRIKQFEASKISKIMNKRGFTSKKVKSPNKGGGSFNDDWRSGTLILCMRL